MADNKEEAIPRHETAATMQVVEDVFELLSAVASAALSGGNEVWPRTPTWTEVCAFPLEYFRGRTDQERAENRFRVALDLWEEAKAEEGGA